MLRFLLFLGLSFFLIGCCGEKPTLSFDTPKGYQKPILLSSLAAPVDTRTWEERADAIEKLALLENAEAPVKKVSSVIHRSKHRSKKNRVAYRISRR